MPRPSRNAYSKCLKIKLKRNLQLHDITNIKNIHLTLDQPMNSNEIICNRLVDCIISTKDINFYHIREHLYDIFIYNLDSYECIWFIVNKLLNMNKLKTDDMTDILIKIYTFLQYYNNNYRPIYHFENFIVYLAMKVHAID